MAAPSDEGGKLQVRRVMSLLPLLALLLLLFNRRILLLLVVCADTEVTPKMFLGCSGFKCLLQPYNSNPLP